MEGWIKLYRKSLSHWLYTENRPHTKREAWEDMLMLCNHDDEKVLVKGQLIDCKRGQSVKSIQSWARDFKWSVQQIRTFFKLLSKDKMIEVEGLPRTTRLTICNYERYQNSQQTANTLNLCQNCRFNTDTKKTCNYINTHNNQKITRQTDCISNNYMFYQHANNTHNNVEKTNSQQPSNNQITTNNNIKNDKEYLFRERFFSVLEIFYLDKNFKHPVRVANAFFDYYEGLGWKNGSGASIENIESVARNWDNKTTQGFNCPHHLLVKWKVMYGILKNITQHYTLFLLIRPAKFEEGKLIIKGSLKDIQEIENNDELVGAWKKALFNSFGKVKIEYEPDKQLMNV